MSLLSMDTSSLFDPFEFPPDMDMSLPKPQPNYREKLEIRTKKLHDHHLKETMVASEPGSNNRASVDMKSRRFDVQTKVHMIETPSTAFGVSDIQAARQKLRDSLTSALDMVVGKQLVKSVLGVGADAIKEIDATQLSLTLEASHSANLSQEHESVRNGQVVESLVVDLGTLATESMNIHMMGDEVSLLELSASVDDYRLNFEQDECGNGADVAESPSKELKTEFADFDDFVHRKLEIEEKEGRIAVEDVKGGCHIVDRARKLATDIEAEFFTLHGSKKAYNQKARSLLFNLRDKSNPELRARVFSGEISPADLCRMSGEQLASKELSDWRNAKEQALDKMLVLTDADTVSGKVVKKTHKGEFVVDVQSESTVDIVLGLARSVFPVDKVDEKVQQDATVQMEEQVNHSPHESKYGGSPSLKRSRSDENDRGGGASSRSSWIAEEKSIVETIHAKLSETTTLLPTVMSLDEYMEAQDDGRVQENVFEDAPIEPRDSLQPNQLMELQESPDNIASPSLFKADFCPPSTTAKGVKEETVGNRDESLSIRQAEVSPSMKLADATPVLAKQLSDTGKTDRVGVAWTGQIQLSGNRQSALVVAHRSGERVDLKHWPKSLELKGRVRLAHLDKFLQELQQSRSRAVTVVSIHVGEGHTDQTSATEHVKEVASQYQMGDRVGFVEPRSGYELYLLPPGSGTTKLLSEHGHPNVSPEALGKDVLLVGVIVWRRSHLSSSRVPDRNNNLKRHAVASSAHHESISKSSRAGVGPLKDLSSDPRSSLRGVTNVSPAASSILPLKFPVESSPTKDSSPGRNWPSCTTTTTTTASHANILKSHRIAPAPSDVTSDVPPGFPVRQSPSSQPSILPRQHLDPRQSDPSFSAADVPPGFWPRPAKTMPPRQPLAEDDDLPEFDFSVHALPPGLLRSADQFNPLPGLSVDPDPPHLSQFPPLLSPAREHLPLPPNIESPSGYPPMPSGPPPPPQDSTSCLSRKPPYYNTRVAAPVSAHNRPHEDKFSSVPQDRSLRGGPGGGDHGQAMLCQPEQRQQFNVGMSASFMQVGGHRAFQPLSSAVSRNDLPEWRPSALFQLRLPVYENNHIGAPSQPHFDSATAMTGAPPLGPPLAVQELNWPPPQHHQQRAQTTLLPIPSLPPQWQPQEQPLGHLQPAPQWKHSNDFQPQYQQPQQQMTPVRPVDSRVTPFNGWDGAPHRWDGTGTPYNEPLKDTRTTGDECMKDPRSNDQLAWYNRDIRDINDERPDFRHTY